MELPSKILEQAVEQLATLPGVGKRSALRYALDLLKRDEQSVRDFGEALVRLKTNLYHCRYCHNLSDTEVCPQQYRGLYHVLGGVISPIDGVGVQDIEIGSLLRRVETGDPAPVEEVILALPTTMEGDTTGYYIHRQLQPTGVKVTTLARGVAVGDSLNYTDEITLGRSIAHRIPFEG